MTEVFYILIFCKKSGSGGIRTHAIEMTGALNQRLRPLGHATNLYSPHIVGIFQLYYSNHLYYT